MLRRHVMLLPPQPKLLRIAESLLFLIVLVSVKSHWRLVAWLYTGPGAAQAQLLFAFMPPRKTAVISNPSLIAWGAGYASSHQGLVSHRLGSRKWSMSSQDCLN